MQIDAVVVAYNSASRLERLLPHLVADPLIGSVVVVDHGRDDSSGVGRRYGATVLVDSSNPGFGAGQNRGVAITSTPHVLLVNPDLVPSMSALPIALNLIDSDPRVAAVQGVIRSEIDGSPERSAGRSLDPVHLWGRLLRLRWLLELRPVRSLVRRLPNLEDHIERAPAKARQVEALAATMILIRRAAFDAVGGFDESFFLYGEDLDLCQRLRAKGWQLWSLPETWAVHASGESSGSRWNRELVWWEGTIRFASLHWSSHAFAAGILAAVARSWTLSIQRPAATRTVLDRLVLEPIRVRRLQR